MLQWSGVLDQLPEGIIFTDCQGIITYINAAAEKLLGLEKGKVIGRSYQEVSCPRVSLDNKGNLFDFIGDALKRGIFYDRVELGCLVQGNKSVVRISTRLLKTGEGWTGILMFFSDCSIEKIFEEQVQRKESLVLVGQMAAGICHEIRNPLQSIKGFVQLLQEKNKENQEISSYSEIIISEINRINSIIKEYLQLVRPPASKFESKNINQIINEVIMLADSEAILRNVVIEKKLSSKMPLIMVDESRIKQVLINILSNALAAITDGGTIRICSWFSYRFREACISILDNGIGMDEKTLSQIGSPFFTTKEEGTGLGLTVSYRIVQDHGGRIEVESSLGKGTKFTIILPETAGMKKKIKNIKRGGYNYGTYICRST